MRIFQYLKISMGCYQSRNFKRLQSTLLEFPENTQLHEHYFCLLALDQASGINDKNKIKKSPRTITRWSFSNSLYLLGFVSFLKLLLVF
jgi:hypothetical protein